MTNGAKGPHGHPAKKKTVIRKTTAKDPKSLTQRRIEAAVNPSAKRGGN